MLNLNQETLNAVVEEACRSAAAHGRWLIAIGRAAYELEVNPYVERNPNGHGLIIGSTSGECYSANGTCTCVAFKYGQPCYHRAMARLVRLHDEREAIRAIIEPAIDKAFAPLHERLEKANREMAELFN